MGTDDKIHFVNKDGADTVIPFKSGSIISTLLIGLAYNVGYRYFNNENQATIPYGNIYSDNLISIGTNTYYEFPITLLEDCYVKGYCTDSYYGASYDNVLYEKGSVIKVGVNNYTTFAILFTKV